MAEYSSKLELCSFGLTKSFPFLIVAKNKKTLFLAAIFYKKTQFFRTDFYRKTQFPCK